MLKLTLRAKLIIQIITTTFIVFGAFLIFNNSELKSISSEQAVLIADDYAKRYAASCKNRLDIDMGYVKALAHIAEDFDEMPAEQRDSIFKNMYLRLIKQNPKYISVWNTIELSFTEPDYPLDYGRKSIVALRTENSFETAELLKDLDGPNEGSAYYKMKQDKLPAIMEPYKDPTVGDMFITSITYPIWKNGDYAGQAGIDIPLIEMQELIDSLHTIDGAISMVASNTGIILGHTSKERVGDTITKMLSFIDDTDSLTKVVKNGVSWKKTHLIDGKPFYTTIVPFYVDGTNSPWAFCITMPTSSFMESAVARGVHIIWIGIFGIGFIVLIIWFSSSKIVNPLSKITAVLNQLTLGNINSNLKLNINTRDEIQVIGESVNKLLFSLQKTENFAQEIEKGNLSSEFELLGKNDRLGNSLLKMRKALIVAKEKDKERYLLDKHHNWTLDGLAKVADLLRQSSNNFEEYMHNLISMLVRYTDSNLGGIYLVNESDNNKKIDLVGSYGFDGEKYDQKSLEYGVGLIGTSMIEAKVVHLNDLPENYTEITSGLGHNMPKSLLIVPLKHKDIVLGAIEMASFKEYEEYKQKFVLGAAEAIASNIESIRVNQNSKELLDKTRIQADKMKVQEEELRQSMEEMMATQEELERSKEILMNDNALLDALMDNLKEFIYFKDQESRFIRISQSMLRLFPVDNIKDMVGKSDFDFQPKDIAQKYYEDERKIQETGKGIYDDIQYEVMKNGVEQWASTTKLPLVNRKGKIIGTFGITKDISNIKKLEIQAREQNERLEKQDMELKQKIKEMEREIITLKKQLIG